MRDDGWTLSARGIVDRQIVCVDCGTSFLFSVREQRFFQEKQFENDPKRCADCRLAKKQRIANGEPVKNRTETIVTCARCNAQTLVPFVPKGDRPVYCRPCFQISPEFHRRAIT